MDVNLIMFRGNGERRDIAIKHERTILGRSDDADLQIPLATVSRKHCVLTLTDESIALRDLGSSNGTFVNGVRVVEATLSAGDNLKIGPVIFTVQIDGSPAEIEAGDDLLLSDEAANPVEHDASDDLGLDDLPSESDQPRRRPAAKPAKPSKPAKVAAEAPAPVLRDAPIGEEEPELVPLDMLNDDDHDADVEREVVADAELDAPSIEADESDSDHAAAADDEDQPVTAGGMIADASDDAVDEVEEEEEGAEADNAPADPLSALAAWSRKKDQK
jgi:hypothetical protein